MPQSKEELLCDYAHMSCCSHRKTGQIFYHVYRYPDIYYLIKKMSEFFSNRPRHGRHLETVHDKPALCKISVKLVQLCLRDCMIERQTASQPIFLLYVLVEIRTPRPVYPTGKWTWWPWGTTMKWREKERERGALWTLSLDDWWCRLTLYQELMRLRRLSFTTRYAK